MATTLELPKDQLIQHALKQMKSSLGDNTWTDRQKLALTCRILFEAGHDSGLAGQITSRGPEAGTYYTQQLPGLRRDQRRQPAAGRRRPQRPPRARHGESGQSLHSWVYRARPDVNCIIHTHPLHIAALSTLEVPLQVSHMDLCPLYDDCAFLGLAGRAGRQRGRRDHLRRPGDKRAILLSPPRPAGHRCEHRGGLRDRGAARARGEDAVAGDGRREIKPIPPALARGPRLISTPKRHGAAFNYYARRCLPRNSDCLS